MASLSIRSVTQAARSTFGTNSLELVKGEGYFYWVFDNTDEKPAALVFDTESVYTMRIRDLTLHQWLTYAADLMFRVGGDRKGF